MLNQFPLYCCNMQSSSPWQHIQSFIVKVVIMKLGSCQTAVRSSKNGFLGCQKSLISLSHALRSDDRSLLVSRKMCLYNIKLRCHHMIHNALWQIIIFWVKVMSTKISRVWQYNCLVDWCSWAGGGTLQLDRCGDRAWVIHIDQSSLVVYLVMQKARLQCWHVCTKPLNLI